MIIRMAVAIVFAVVMGNGSVVAFNRMPAKWFEDYPEDAEIGSDAEKELPQKLLEADARDFRAPRGNMHSLDTSPSRDSTSR